MPEHAARVRESRLCPRLGKWTIPLTTKGNAQGPHRFARGQAFFKHLNETYPSRHKLLVVPDCYHNADCMFRSQVARGAVFAPGN